MKWLVICIMLVVVGPVFGEDQVRSIQEELRRRNVYFGDIDGTRSAEFESALRTYQRRKGFAASGREDRDTLRSLGLVQPSADDPVPQELSWPEEPVLRSDIGLDPKKEQAEIIAERRAGIEQATAGPDPAEPRRHVPASRGGSRRGEPAPRAGVLQMSERDISAFIRGYLGATSTGLFRTASLSKEMPYFADRVDYFDYGMVDRVLIERALQRYYRRWPARRYSLAGNVHYVPMPQAGQVEVRFRLNFQIKNGRKQVRGQTENRWLLDAATVNPRIVSMKERRVRE